MPSVLVGCECSGEVRDAFMALGWDAWSSGAARRAAVEESIEFVRLLAAYCEAEGIPYVIENPIGVLSTRWRKPTQTIQPWMFGHVDLKATCLWLSGVPRLVPTKIIPKAKRVATIHRMRPGKNRQRDRSRTFRGIATAMARQWTDALTSRKVA